MKLEKLEDKIKDVFHDGEFTVETEFVTTTGARVDLAIHRNSTPVLAIEFEESYKWMRARSLYDAVKANEEGFANLAIVYPFDQRGLKNCWIFDFVESDLDVSVKIIKPESIDEIKEIFCIG